MSCNAKFTKLPEMYVHEEKEHGKVRTFGCDTCGKKFFQDQHLADHNKAVHNLVTPVTTASTPKVSEEKRKEAKSTPSRQVEDKTDDKKDPNEDVVGTPKTPKNKAKEKKVKQCLNCHKQTNKKLIGDALCDECDEKLGVEVRVFRMKDEDIKPHDSSKEKKLSSPSSSVNDDVDVCEFEDCDRVFLTKSALADHVTQDHGKKKQKRGNESPKKNGKKRKLYNSEIMEIDSDTASNASNADEDKENNKKFYHCDDCPKKFTRKDTLAKHKSREHN